MTTNEKIIDDNEDCMTCKFNDCEYRMKGEWCMEWELEQAKRRE